MFVHNLYSVFLLFTVYRCKNSLMKQKISTSGTVRRPKIKTKNIHDKKKKLKKKFNATNDISIMSYET